MNQKIKKAEQILVVVIILAAVAGFTSCEKFKIMPVPFNKDTSWSFKADIQPIFSANCITCHNGSRSPDLREGKSYSALSKGYLNSPADPANSRLYLKITSSDHVPRTTDNEKLEIEYWIKQGALNN